MTIFGRSLALIAGAAALFAVGLAPAKASYMMKCEELIGAEAACLEAGGVCKEETQAIIDECKCHKKKGDEWKLVVAAVGKDDVCSASIPEEDVPPPHEPRPPEGNTGKGNFDKGNFDRDRGGDPKGDSDRGNMK